MTGASEVEGAGGRASGAALLRRTLATLRERSEVGASRRFALGAFAARVVNAGLAFGTQILLARWLGERGYGVYSAIWVWVLVGGGILSLGLPVAALRLVPEYRERQDWAALRAFLARSRGLGALPSLALAALALPLLWSLSDRLGPYWPVAAVALLALPPYVLTDIQTGIARAWDFADLGLIADYILRPLLLLGLAAAFYLAGAPGTATAVMALTVAAVALTALGQGLALERRVRARVPPGPSRPDYARWRAVAWPMLTVTGFTLMLGAADVLLLQFFVRPEEIAVYVAATKLVAIASFVGYGVANTSAHRFAAQMARGDRAAMARLAGATVRWTFWPTLAVVLALSLGAEPILALFGPGFAAGAPLVAVLGAGLVAGAAVGPADRALAMADHGRVTAAIYAAALAANVALCLALIPAFGPLGAAAGTALALALRAALLFAATRRRLGLTMSIVARPAVAR